MAVINTNIKAIVAQESSRQVNLKLATAMERLSTGLRINSAKDDAAGLAISERMNAQVRGLGMAIKNANDGLSMAQTADGAYGEVTSMLQRMRELAVQAATGSMGPLDRESLQLEINELKIEIENVAIKTHFNGIKLLDGTARSVHLQIGANQGDTMDIAFDSVRTKDIGSGLRPALTSVGGKVETFDAFVAGDLIINGTMVNASLSTDDNKSPAGVSEQQTITFTTATALGTPSIVFTGLNGPTTVNVAAPIGPIPEVQTITFTDNATGSAGTVSITAIGLAGTSVTISVSLDGTETAGAVAVAAVAAINADTATHGISATSAAGVVTLTYPPIGDVVVGTATSDTASPTATFATVTGGTSPATPTEVAAAFLTAINNTTVTSGVTAVAALGVVTLTYDSRIGNAAAATITPNTATFTTAAAVVTTTEASGPKETAASALAKVAAINRVTEQSGVFALANETNVQGSSMTAPAGSVTAAAITINGVATASVGLGTDNETNRAAISKAINDISAQTGVRAINTGDVQQGVRLVADDGRNVSLNLGGSLTTANTGLAVAGTYVGSYSLYSVAGDPIKIEHQIGSDITGTGLRMGTYQPDIASMVTLERSGSGSVSSGPTLPATAGTPPVNSAGVGVLRGDTLVVNDIAIDAARTTDDTASLSTIASAKAASAIAIAAAINKRSDLHGVTARAEPNVIRSEVVNSFAAGASGVINLNGISISIASTSRNIVMESINTVSGQTGVVAKEFGQGIELIAEDGRNIVLGASSGLSAGNLGLSGVSIGNSSNATAAAASDGNVFYSTVSLVSDKAFTVARGSEGGDNFSRLGFREGTFGGSNTGVKVDEVDVSTQNGAGIAITAIDAALEDVSTAQARSGAYQNRLDVIVNVQSEASENLTASRSRIMDADYALEATNLAKAQIVAQAATAMLAQANQSQQTVLQLLQ